MKNAINILVIFFSIVYLLMVWFMSYLVYKHIGATELMWFLFWVNVPFSILTTIVGRIVEHINNK